MVPTCYNTQYIVLCPRVIIRSTLYGAHVLYCLWARFPENMPKGTQQGSKDTAVTDQGQILLAMDVGFLILGPKLPHDPPPFCL